MSCDIFILAWWLRIVDIRNLTCLLFDVRTNYAMPVFTYDLRVLFIIHLQYITATAFGLHDAGGGDGLK